MIIGLPREVKDGEHRVALTPASVRALTARGHQVMVEAGAGAESGIADAEYTAVGGELRETAADVWTTADMIVKVKEPLPSEFPYLQADKILFTYLHLASSRPLTDALRASGITAIGYETVQLDDGSLPLLVPMSEVAGRMAVQTAMRLLEKDQGGRGILMGGVPGVPPADVVILGCGVAGMNAAKVAIGLGANVTIIDINHDRLRYIDDVLSGRVITVYSNEHNIERAVRYADVVIGAVLITGHAAPVLVTESMVREMTPRAVLIDVAVDQGGCIETTRPTSHSHPTYTVHDVVHYCVPNIPAAVPRTSTYALTNATLPYVLRLADHGLAALQKDAALTRGANVLGGHIVCPAVADTFGMECVDVCKLVA